MKMKTQEDPLLGQVGALLENVSPTTRATLLRMTMSVIADLKETVHQLGKRLSAAAPAGLNGLKKPNQS